MSSTLARREVHRTEPAAAMAESGRFESSVMRRSIRAARPSEPESPRRPPAGDGVLALCLLVLVGVVIAGGLLMLFSWVTSAIPRSQLTACPYTQGCGTPAPLPEEGVAPIAGGLRLDEPRMAP